MTTYSTNFPSAPENPLSEGGAWSSNAPANVFTVIKTVTGPNRAVGTQSGTGPNGGVDDSYSTLTGTWSANHTIQGVVYNPDQFGAQEMELHLRFADTPSTATGYELNIEASGGYTQIVTWNGAEGNFTVIAANQTGPFPANTLPVATGDIIKAFINNRDISYAVNKSPGFAGFQEILSTVDSTFSTGKPGIGTFFSGGTQINLGFTSVSAADLTGAQVRQSAKANTATNTATVTFPQAVLAGSCVVVGAMSFGAIFSTLTIADGSSDAFTDSGKGAFVDAFAVSRMGAFLTPTTGVTAFTATSNATGTSGTDIFAWEITGLTAPFSIDKVAAAAGTGTAANSGSTGTLTDTNEMALGMVVNSTHVTFPGISWVTGGGGISSHGNIGQYQPISSNASVSSTAPLASGSWRAWALTVMGQQTAPPNMVLQGGKSLRFT